MKDPPHSTNLQLQAVSLPELPDVGRLCEAWDRLCSLPQSSAAGTAGRPPQAAHLDRLQDVHRVIDLLVPQAGGVLTFHLILIHLILCCSNNSTRCVQSNMPAA